MGFGVSTLKLTEDTTMQLSFLCTKHADWVYSHPQQALHCLARDEMQGTMLFMDGKYRDCIAYLGCAYDITAILLEVEEGKNDGLINKLQSLASLLCSAYKELRLNEYTRALDRRTSLLLVAATRPAHISASG